MEVRTDMAIPVHADPEADARQRNESEYVACINQFYWLVDITDGLPINQFDHSLQCAALAVEAGARDEMVVAALLHDVGKPLSMENHPAVAAEMLRGRVSEDTYWVLKTHGDVQTAMNWGQGLEMMERAYGQRNWWADALALGAWDHASFEPGKRVPGIEAYYPVLRRVYGLDMGENQP